MAPLTNEEIDAMANLDQLRNALKEQVKKGERYSFIETRAAVPGRV